MADIQPLTDDKKFDDRGIPLKSDYPAKIQIPVLYSVFATIFLIIGLGIAFAVYKLGATSKYDAKISLLASYDLGWVYVGFFCVKLGVLMININLGVARKAAKINVPDQHVYKVYTPEGAPPLGYALMESEGALGAFNRAQRAYQNYLENAPLFVAYYLLAGFVFSFPTFITGIYYAVTRLVATFGYTSSPNSRLAGNVLGNIGVMVLEGFVLVAGIKALM